MTKPLESAKDILIRYAVIDECEAIASVLREAFIEYETLYTPEGFAATTPTAHQIAERWDEGPVWVAIKNKEILGTVAVVPKDSGLYIRSMAVLPGARGQGIAKRLLDEIEHYAINHRYDHLILNTTHFLKEAIHLYEYYGFQRIDEGKPDAFGRVLFTMVKRLNRPISLEEVSIRTYLKPGDLGYVIHLHGQLYGKEYGYGIHFESYVARGLCEFYETYDPQRSRVWVCEHKDRIIGFLLLMDRSEAAQLRYFLIEPEYRGIGLGSALLGLYMDFLRGSGYQRSYLWTTHELTTAANLYKRFGFQLTEEVESTSFGKPLREQRYELILS